MQIYRWILCFLFVTSCTLNNENFYQSGVVPPRPINGFDRNSLFPKRLEPSESLFGDMCTMFRARTDWTPSKIDFRSTYSSFQIELLTFNNFDSSKSFTWQERIMFADALELVVFAINHPLFEEKMESKTFYYNDTTHQIPSIELIQKLRKTVLSFIIAKEDLDENILAQATIGGFNHIIWFRSDVDYQQYSVLYLATILGHELTHNLGYLHSSNVPYAVDDIILEIITEASAQDAQIFKNSTPSYYEDMFLQRVRDRAPRSYSSSVIPTQIQKDTVKDFGGIFKRD